LAPVSAAYRPLNSWPCCSRRRDYLQLLSDFGDAGFLVVRVENILTVFRVCNEAGRWPVTLYPAWLRYGLTFVIPVAFATTVPVEALTNRLNWVTLLVAFILAVVLFAASRVFWKLGLKHYSGTSA